jgi:hypothetical protein
VNRTGTRYLKPKGMHWRTFNALCDRLAAVEEEKDAVWMVGAASRGDSMTPTRLQHARSLAGALITVITPD